MFHLEAPLEKEEPAPPECSSEKEESREKKTDISEMMRQLQKKNLPQRLYYDQDITGNEDDSVFRKIEGLFH